jgi:hypothetical protein
MKRALALLVACGTPPTAPQKPAVIPQRAPADAAVPVVHGRLVPVTAERRAIAAPHAGEIHTLAMTADGKAAISCDELGGVRLWAALDGSVEPHVVELAEPKQLAIAAHDRGFLVAALDPVGNLTIVQLDLDGRTRAKEMISGDAAFVGVAMTSEGPLAWRTDETLELYTFDGALAARLGTEPGQRLVGVAANGAVAAAIVEAVSDDKRVRIARGVTLEPKLAWGAKLDIQGEATGQLALSPSGKRLAIAIGAPPAVPIMLQLVDASTGKVSSTEPINTTTAFGFGDETHVALAQQNAGIRWLAADGTAKPPAPTAMGVGALATGGGRAIAPQNGGLLVSSPTDNAYLGYELESPSVAAAGPDGTLVVGFMQTLTALDAKLDVAAAAMPAIPDGASVADLVWLDGADWLVESSQPDGTTQVALVATDGRAPQIVRRGLRVIQPIKYDAATHVATLSLAFEPEIDRYDPAARKIDKLASLPRGKVFEETELVPVTPALASGVQIVKVAMRDRSLVEWHTDAKAATRATATVDSFVAADPAGHVFAWNNQPTGPLELDIYDATGARVGVLPHDGPVGLWPDPRGTRVVEVGQQAVALYTVDGKLVWSQNIGGGNQALWLSDGAIAIVTAVGIARLDAATGAVQSAKCGWRFGLSPKPHPVTPRIEPVCVQIDH